MIRPKTSIIIHERMSGTELDELMREPTEQEKKEFEYQNALFRIMFDGSSYSIQKKVSVQLLPTLWQTITGKLKYEDQWKSLDKFGSPCIMVLHTRFTWPQFYSTKEECIRHIGRWSKEIEYYYPPNYK